MTPKNYTFLYLKYFLGYCRFCGITFGGLTASMVTTPSTSPDAKKDQKLEISSKLSLKIFELVTLVATSLTSIAILASVFLLYRNYTEESQKVVVILDVISQLFFTLDLIVFVTSAQRYGRIIAEFVSSVPLTRWQFWTLWGCQGGALGYVVGIAICETVYYLWTTSSGKLLSDKLSLASDRSADQKTWVLGSNDRNWSTLTAVSQFAFYYYAFCRLSVSITCQILCSLVCYWRLQTLSRRLLVSKPVSRLTRASTAFNRVAPNSAFTAHAPIRHLSAHAPESPRKRLEQFCREFVDVRERFGRIDSKLGPTILFRFTCCICFILLNAYLANHSQASVIQICQFGLDLALAMAFCLVHDLPHQASTDLHNRIDLMVDSGLDKSDLIYAKMVTKNSIGFRLLGVRYDKGLIGPVSDFLLDVLNRIL